MGGPDGGPCGAGPGMLCWYGGGPAGAGLYGPGPAGPFGVGAKVAVGWIPTWPGPVDPSRIALGSEGSNAIDQPRKQSHIFCLIWRAGMSGEETLAEHVGRQHTYNTDRNL
jgi:hypothetical protein